MATKQQRDEALKAHLWPKFRVGDYIVVKDYVFRICYIKATGMSLEPVGPVKDVEGVEHADS